MLRHVERVQWKDVEKTIRELSPRLADTLAPFATDKRRLSAASMLLARYEYGKQIIGEAAGFQHIIPPCGKGHDCCTDCQQLVSSSLAGRPLGIVITRSLESYLEYVHDKEESSSPRIVPLRKIVAGDIFGTLEVLQHIKTPTTPSPRTYFPMLRICSGMRSVFISMPLAREDVGRTLKRRLPLAVLRSVSDLSDDGSIARRFDKNNWLLCKTVADALSYENGTDPWVSEIVFLPLPWLFERILRRSVLIDKAKDFVLLLHELASQQSNNLRTFHLQQAALSRAFQNLTPNNFADRTVQHLLSIASGDFPGFAPASGSAEGGPFMAILDYLLDAGLNEVNSIEGSFPAIIEPKVLRLHAYEHTSADFVYYSLRLPSLPGPVEDTRRSDFLSDLHTRMQRIDHDPAGLFPPVEWLFAASRPIDSPSLNIDVKINSACNELRQDFREQFTIATTKWQVKSYDDFFPTTRAKFLSSIVRLRAKRISTTRQQAVLT